MSAAATGAPAPQTLIDATPQQPAARLALVVALPAPTHAYLFRRPPGIRASARRPAPSPPSCWPRAPPTPTTPAAARCSTPRRTPTSSGSAARAQHLVETCASG